MKRKSVSDEIDEYTHQIDVLETQLAELKEYAIKLRDMTNGLDSFTQEYRLILNNFDTFIKTI